MKTSWLTRWGHYLGFSLVMIAGLSLSGCGGGGGSSSPPPTPNADPTGYYSVGSLSALGITDLQAMIYKDQILLFSKQQGIGFDGKYAVRGNTITGNLVEYGLPGLNDYTATFTATFNTTDHSIFGKLTTNNSITDAPFTLTYAAGHPAASVSTLVSVKTSANWTGTFYNNTNDVLTINLADNGSGEVALTTITPATDRIIPHYTYFTGCDFSGALTPVAGSLYSVSLSSTSCDTRSYPYTGLAVLNGSTLVVAATHHDSARGFYIGIFAEFQ